MDCRSHDILVLQPSPFTRSSMRARHLLGPPKHERATTALQRKDTSISQAFASGLRGRRAPVEIRTYDKKMQFVISKPVACRFDGKWKVV